MAWLPGEDANNSRFAGLRISSSQSREARVFGRRPYSRAIHGMVISWARFQLSRGRSYRFQAAAVDVEEKSGELEAGEA